MEPKHQTHKKLLKRKRKPSGGHLPEDFSENLDNEIKEPKEKEKDSKENTKITLSNKKPNRKKLLKIRLEFLLSDINLYHDQFLRRTYLSNNKGISPDIFLKCKSIKALLSDIEKNDKRRNELIKAVEISKDLIYNKASDKIGRKTPYNNKLIDIDMWNSCTIFVPNFPPGVNQQMIYDIFPEYKILYINLLIKKTKKEEKKYKQAYIILKEKEDVQKIINQYEGKLITKYKIFEEPIHIMAKTDINKNDDNNKENNIEKNINNDDKNKNNKIGSFDICANDLLDGNIKEKWYYIKEDKNDKGSVYLKTQLVSPNAIPFSEGLFEYDNINIKFLDGENLIFEDIYCRCKLTDDIDWKQTRTITKCENPQWNQTIILLL